MYMNSNEFRNILKKDSKAFVSNKQGNFIRIIADYLHINNFCIVKPSDIHIVNDEFVTIDEKVRIDMKDINEVMVL